MRITISGLSGSGTSTIAAGIAEQLDFPLISAGEEFRDFAHQTGRTVEELNAYAERTPEFERRFANRLMEEANSHSDFVFESRYTGRQLDSIDLRIWLSANRQTRARRVSERESISLDEAREIVRIHEQSVRKRVEQFYDDLELEDLSIYDVQVNTELWDPDDLTTILVEAVELLEESSIQKRDLIHKLSSE